MTIAVQNTALTNTFDFWRTRTNELAYAMSTYAVTTGANAAVGNAAITGTFTAGGFSGNALAILSATFSINATTISWPTVSANLFSGNTANVVSLFANSVSAACGAYTNAVTFGATINVAGVGTFGNVSGNNAVITTATVTTGNIGTLTGTTANITSVYSNTGTFPNMVLTSLTWGGIGFQTPNSTFANGSYWMNGNGQFAQISGLSVGGGNTALQYANGAPLGGNGNLTFNYTTATLGISNAILLGSALAQYANVTTTGTSQQTLDTFALSAYQAAEYIISAKDNNANNFQLSKILMLHAGGTPTITEFGTIISNTALATFDATSNTTTAILQVTPTSANVSFKIQKTLLA